MLSFERFSRPQILVFISFSFHHKCLSRERDTSKNSGLWTRAQAPKLSDLPVPPSGHRSGSQRQAGGQGPESQAAQGSFA